MRPSTERKERIDLQVWSDSGMHSMESIIHRASEMRVMLEKMGQFKHLFANANTVLEIGGGHCWASCMVKWRNPTAYVTGSDIAPDALQSTHHWERLFQTELDAKVVCKSYDLPFPSATLDLIFVFAAAHHFGRHRSTLKEIARVLKPGGTALYLHEPACPPFWYPMAYRRVNRLGYGVPEDLLLLSKLQTFAEDAGMSMTVVKDVTTTNRGPIQGIYYLILGKIKLLQRLMPCSVDIVFTKDDQREAT